jgi:hypothetical protein
MPAGPADVLGQQLTLEREQPHETTGSLHLHPLPDHPGGAK